MSPRSPHANRENPLTLKRRLEADNLIVGSLKKAERRTRPRYVPKSAVDTTVIEWIKSEELDR